MCIRWEKGDAFPAGMCGVVEHPRALSAVIQMWFSGFSLGVCEGDVRNFFVACKRIRFCFPPR